MVKKFKYTSFITFIVLLNLYAYIAYPNTVVAEENSMQELSISESDNVSQFIMLTDYLFINNPIIGEEINPDVTYGVDSNQKYTVVDAISGKSGLDAFIVRDEYGNYILSIRGTEGYARDGDLMTDTKLMLNENDQYSELINFLKQSKYGSKINYVVGHSLGGSIALNISMWMLNNGHDLEHVYVFAPAPIINDDNVNNKTVEQLNQKLTLIVFDNEVLYNFGNLAIGLTDVIKAYDPYKIFGHYVISVDNDVNNGFTNHFISQMIPIVKKDEVAKYRYEEFR